VQLVGVFLVFSSLIVPALATAGMRGRGRLIAAYVIGALGYILGLAFSAVFDLPSGALIVWTLAGCALLAQAVPAVRRSHPAHEAERPVFDTVA
jgi:zinc/manganese transport system permease protein